MSLPQVAFKFAFQLSPIVLTNGIATNLPEGALPIIALTEAVNFVDGLLSGPDDISLDNFFANFEPVAGATIIDQDIGSYPFANQAVAANAVIANPLQISFLMKCPARGEAGYAVKLATMSSLQSTLKQHNASGGTYTVVTPSFYYTNCIMRSMRDVSSGESNQYQYIWQMDFVRPLITLDEAQSVESNLMSKITSGVAINGQPSWSALASTVANPFTAASAAIIPAAKGAAAAAAGAVSGLSSAASSIFP